jgi:hypothetical protein
MLLGRVRTALGAALLKTASAHRHFSARWRRLYHSKMNIERRSWMAGVHSLPLTADELILSYTASVRVL